MSGRRAIEGRNDAVKKVAGGPPVRVKPNLREEAANLGMRHIKAALLAHYARRQPQSFVQLDGFADMVADDVSRPDEDGDVLWQTITVELMAGATVRVLIDPQAPRATGVRLLRKLADLWERMPESGGCSRPWQDADGDLMPRAMELAEAADKPRAYEKADDFPPF